MILVEIMCFKSPFLLFHQIGIILNSLDKKCSEKKKLHSLYNSRMNVSSLTISLIKKRQLRNI